MMCCLALLAVAHEAAAQSDFVSENPVERRDCQAQLQLIYEAIQEYRQQHQQLPDKLSDLVPDFLADRKILVCPVVYKTRDLPGWRAWIRDDRAGPKAEVFSDHRTSYAYEFCLEPIRVNVWRGIAKTHRQYKERQMEKLGPIVPIVRCFAHRSVLNLSFGGDFYDSKRYWEDEVARAIPHRDLEPSRLFAESSTNDARQAIPSRSHEAPARLIDLSSHYNGSLVEDWQGFPGNHFLNLTPGVQVFNEVPFDVRGVIQLAASGLPRRYEKAIKGIKVGLRCRRLHFLHACGFGALRQAEVAKYVIAYSDHSREVPVIYGRDIADWWFSRDRIEELPELKVVWSGENEAAKSYGKSIRLCQMVWTNPSPDIEITSMSLEARSSTAAPFLIAITAEQ